MSEPRDPRTRHVDRFDAPSDYGDPWRVRGLPVLLTAFAPIALGAILVLILL
jgi:hypothetical protein